MNDILCGFMLVFVPVSLWFFCGVLAGGIQSDRWIQEFNPKVFESNAQVMKSYLLLGLFGLILVAIDTDRHNKVMLEKTGQ